MLEMIARSRKLPMFNNPLLKVNSSAIPMGYGAPKSALLNYIFGLSSIFLWFSSISPFSPPSLFWKNLKFDEVGLFSRIIIIQNTIICTFSNRTISNRCGKLLNLLNLKKLPAKYAQFSLKVASHVSGIQNSTIYRGLMLAIVTCIWKLVNDRPVTFIAWSNFKEHNSVLFINNLENSCSFGGCARLLEHSHTHTRNISRLLSISMVSLEFLVKYVLVRA